MQQRTCLDSYLATLRRRVAGCGESLNQVAQGAGVARRTLTHFAQDTRDLSLDSLRRIETFVNSRKTKSSKS